jgi:RHS repeat-associated protein
MYGFNGKEKDNEIKGTGNSLDFGARVYDSRLGRWLSVDPKNQFVFSPYQSFVNNPIKHIDPDGGWVPGVDKQGNITLTAEKGDTRKTLFSFFNSDKQAKKFLPSYAQSKLIVFSKNDVIQLNSSNFSEAMKDAQQNSKKYENEKTYNCTDAAYSGSKGYSIINSEETTGNPLTGPFDAHSESMPVRFQEQLDAEFKPVSNINELVFGQTIGTLREKSGGNVEHAAVYFGKSKNGTAYVFTKNGLQGSKPAIMPLVNMLKIYSNLTIQGNKDGQTGLYNPIGTEPAAAQK